MTAAAASKLKIFKITLLSADGEETPIWVRFGVISNIVYCKYAHEYK